MTRASSRFEPTSLGADRVRLPVVLSHVAVHEVYDVGPDGGAKHGGQDHESAGRVALLTVHGNQGLGARLSGQ